MTTLSPELLEAILREDLSSFIAKGFETLNPGKVLTRRSTLTISPMNCANVRRQEDQAHHLHAAAIRKSTIASVLYPAWRLGHDPSLRIICISYAQELAFKLSSDFRKVVDSDWYQKLFPGFGSILQSARSERFRLSPMVAGLPRRSAEL